MNMSLEGSPMGTTELKLQLEALRAEWAKAPMTTKLMAGAYMTPLLDLLGDMVLHMEGLSNGH